MIFHIHVNGPRYTPELAIAAVSSGVSESNEVFFQEHKGRKLMRFKKCHVCKDMKKVGTKILIYFEPIPAKEKPEPVES
jgi:hypothetical protein